MSKESKEASATHATLDDWIAREATPFSVDSPRTFNAAVEKVIASLGDSVELLGFGEALHGGKDILILRNRLFQLLVEAHGYSAIAIESSFPRAHVVNEYVAGRGPASYEAVQDTGFSHGFGRLDANRELVEWMRRYNADPSHHVKLQFYGFDSPTEMYGSDSPRHVLYFVLEYLASIDRASGQERRQRIDPLLGQDADWELGPELLVWWPAGSHLHAMPGPRYAVIGSAVGVSDANGIGPPEAGTLDARLTAAAGPALFIPTHKGQGLPAPAIGALPTR